MEFFRRYMSVTINAYSIGNFFFESGQVETIPEVRGNWAIDDKVRTGSGSLDFGFWIFVVIEQRMSSGVSKSVCPCSTNFLSHYLPSTRHRF